MSYTFEECCASVLTIIRSASFITLIEFDDKVKLGMYYLMKMYGLGFRHVVRASWEWFELCTDNGNGLLARDIEQMSYDPVVYAELKKAHDSGIMPEGFRSNDSEQPPNKATEDWGVAIPSGAVP